MSALGRFLAWLAPVTPPLPIPAGPTVYAAPKINNDSQAAESLAKGFEISIEPTHIQPGPFWRACSSKVESTIIYGQGDTINEAILDCCKRIVAVSKALRGNS